MNRISLASLGLSLFLLSPLSQISTQAAPHLSVARINASGEKDAMESQAPVKLPAFSGNIAGGTPLNRAYADRTYDVSSPGMMIGPSPEVGETDPRFAGGVHGEAAGQDQVGGMSSNVNAGFPSAAENNNGTIVSRSGITQIRTGPDGMQKPENLDRETAGSAPFVLGAALFILAAFLFTTIRSRGPR